MTVVPKGLRAEWRGPNGVRLHWRVDDLDTAMAAWDAVQVYSAPTETGTYTPLGDQVALEADQAEYTHDHAAGTETTWYTVAFYEASGPTEGDMVDGPVEGSGGGVYASVADLRAEGVTATQASNKRLRRLLAQAESHVEHTTRRWFWPKQMRLRLNGSGARLLCVEPEIIQVDDVSVLWSPSDEEDSETTTAVGLGSVVVYNRHLTMGLLEPDDREAPALARDYGRWPGGRQSVVLSGWFGYTELPMGEAAGETAPGSQKPISRGVTPPNIKDAVMRLVVRGLPEIADVDEVQDTAMAHRIQRIKTRDQEIQYSASGGGRGAGLFTSDRFIDDILAAYMRPARASMV